MCRSLNVFREQCFIRLHSWSLSILSRVATEWILLYRLCKFTMVAAYKDGEIKVIAQKDVTSWLWVKMEVVWIDRGVDSTFFS